MIQLTPHMRIYLFTEPADFRKGIDGLVQLCRERIEKADPFSGSLFLFVNRRRQAIKGLVYDGQGFWLVMKRLSKSRFRHWPTRSAEHDPSHVEYLARELHVLLWNGNPEASTMDADWKRIEP